MVQSPAGTKPIYYPNLEQVRGMVGQGNFVPIYREILADLETPVSAFLKIQNGAGSFLLESVEGGERLARYSFIGTDPYLSLRVNEPGESNRIDPLLPVQAELGRYRLVPVEGLPRFHGGAVGYLSYEAVTHFEKLPSPDYDELRLPEAIFFFADTLLVFDHLKRVIKVVSHVSLEGDIEAGYQWATVKIDRLVEKLRRDLPPQSRREPVPHRGDPPAIQSNRTQAQFEAMVERCREYIIAGDVIQVVPSQRFSRPTGAPPFDIYRALRIVNPSPYMFYFDFGDFHLIGASPELLVQVEDGWVQTDPIAGTKPRGKTPEEDLALENELRNDEKERAEHIMLVDLGRNDIGRVSQPGTVEVIDLFDVERYSHVMHLVSRVRGKLRPEMTQFDALRACFPAGTLSGAPKIRAMEIIAELEPSKRGPYGGAVGYFSYSGTMDTCITIRTMVLKDGVARVQAGGGVVYDSVPSVEYQETRNKAGALFRAIDLAEDLGSLS